MDKAQQSAKANEIPDNLQHYVQHSISAITNDISKVLEDRFISLKRELAADNSHSIQTVAKKIRLESHDFKSKGNKQQYDHQISLVEHMEQAKLSIQRCDLEEAKAALDEGISQASNRCKLILLADKSDHGWATVAEYVANELAENSDDEKKMHKAEKVAEKKATKRKKDKFSSRRPSDTPNLPFRQSFPTRFSSFTTSPFQPLIGPCFKISTLSHITSSSDSTNLLLALLASYS